MNRDPERGSPLQFDAPSHGDHREDTPNWLKLGTWVSAIFIGVVLVYLRTRH